MSRLFLKFVFSLICLQQLVICSTATATDVYVYTDKQGRQHFSDNKPDEPYQLQNIKPENNYPWAEAPAYKPGKKRKRKKRATSQKNYSLTELKTKCHAARGKYNSFRGTNKNIDWDTYRARLEKYKAKRDEWCSRLARGK